MAGAPNGTVVATWMHFNDGVSSSIQASIRRPNGTFSAPITLSDPSDYSTDPRVDVANDGTATIVYLANTSTELVAKAVTLRPDGSATQPFGLTEFLAQDVKVAVAPSGRATAVWVGFDGEHAVVKTSQQDTRGRFGPERTLSPAGNSAFFPLVAFGKGNLPIITWGLSLDNGALSTVQAVRQLPGGDYSPVSNLSEAGAHTIPYSIEATDAGEVAIGMIRTPDGVNESTTQLTISRDGRSFTAPVTINDEPGTTESASFLAAGRAGEFHIAWQFATPSFSEFGFKAGVVRP